jgi:hypothetical protein
LLLQPYKVMVSALQIGSFSLAVSRGGSGFNQNNLFWSLISTKLQCNKYQTGDQNKLFWSKISAVSLTAWLSSGCNEPSDTVQRALCCRAARLRLPPVGSGVSAGRAVVVMAKMGNGMIARYNNLPISCVESQ